MVHYQDKQGKKKVRAGRVRLRVISDASSEVLLKFLNENVTKGAVVRTDGWKGYLPVARNGFVHDALVGETSVEVAEQLIHIHRVLSNLKTWLLGTHHGVSAKHLQACLNEYTFRFNRRMTPFQSFQSVLGIGTHVEGPEYEDIYSAGEEGRWAHANPRRYYATCGSHGSEPDKQVFQIMLTNWYMCYARSHKKI